jgi:hypothetical protein
MVGLLKANNKTHENMSFDEDGSYLPDIIMILIAVGLPENATDCVISLTNVSNQYLHLWTEILLTEDSESLAKAVVVVDGSEDILERWWAVAPDAAVEVLNRSK